MLFFRIFQHLLPRGEAWKVTIEKALRRFFVGLAEEPGLARTFADEVFLDLFPTTARTEAGGSGALEEWERQYALEPNTDEETRRLALAAEWRATGGQSPDYIQNVLQTAGFPVYVHDWWSSGPPYVARDPRDYTEQPLVGTWRCGSVDNTAPMFKPTCSSFSSGPRCNRFLNNDVRYLVNKDLSRRAPPPIPSDPSKWPFFFYVGGETFPEHASIPEARREAFERLLLKLRPTHQWVVTLVDYSDPEDVFLITEDGDPMTTEDEELLIA